LHELPATASADAAGAVRLRVCATPLSTNPALAGCKTLNRLDSVLARAEWKDARIWEGLMRDVDGSWVCGTMSNLFLRRGAVLMTPLLDRCGVAGVMRRWILQSAGTLRLRAVERRIRWEDLKSSEEIFMSNAVVGIRSVRSIEGPHAATLRFSCSDTAARLRSLLETQ
jgi:4-amino-4-deoxychorismate lyase